MRKPLSSAFFSFLLAILPAFGAFGQDRPARAMLEEVDRYEAHQRNLYLSQGKRYDASARDSVLGDRKALARRYAAEIESRPGLESVDVYYLGRLYAAAENDKKTLETMQRFVANPPDASTEAVRSALSFIVVVASKLKQTEIAEQAYLRWEKDILPTSGQRPVLLDHLATGYYRDGKHGQAIKHAQTAFDLLKTVPTKTLQEKRSREQVYMNLVELLALGYKKVKNSDQALNILAEARAQSFTLPSANLYRKVMTFVEGSGFSEKKMMQKVDSYATADPAPELAITEWIGQEAVSLEDLRGKLVLLDFWATWCGPCIATFPRLRDWHKKFAGNDFIIVGVTQYYGEQDGKRMTQLQEIEYLTQFRLKHKLPYPFAVARAGEAGAKYGVNAYPTTVLLDRNGVVRYIGIGSGVEESENLEGTIKKILKEETRVANR